MLAGLAHQRFASIRPNRAVIAETRQAVDQFLRQHALEIAAMHIRLLMVEEVDHEQVQVRIPAQLGRRVMLLAPLRESEESPLLPGNVRLVEIVERDLTTDNNARAVVEQRHHRV